MKKIILSLVTFTTLLSCQVKETPGVKQKNDPELYVFGRLDTAVVKSIRLSYGEFFIITYQMTKDDSTFDVKTRVLEYNIGDTVLVQGND